MFYRPLAGVLSSLSRRCLQSTRLFCATATSANDQIPTVRTTGILWKKDGSGNDKGTLSGIYWGEGDPRNTKSRGFNSKGTKGAMLRSIMMALEQAKKCGFKRIRVQTDLEIDEVALRKAAQDFMNMDPVTKEKLKYCLVWYSSRIVEYMDEMEVILEYRTAYTVQGTNDVIALLNEDSTKDNRNSSLDFTSAEYESDWTITPKDASPLEGRTVPTVYVAGRLLNDNTVGTRASLWIPESVQHLEISRRPLGSAKLLRISPLTLPRVHYAAIRDAIKEVQFLNIPEIQVITESLHFINFFKCGWLKDDGSYMTNKFLYFHIKELTEKIKVHFKGVRFTEESDDEFMKKVHEMANGVELKQNRRTTNHGMSIGKMLSDKDATGEEPTRDHKHTPQATVLPSASSECLQFAGQISPTSIDDEIPTVRTTGNHRKEGGISQYTIGVYWGEGDRRNTKKWSDFSNDIQAVQLGAIMVALEQAREAGLTRLRVQTDSNMDELSIRRMAGKFKMRDLASRTKLQFSEEDRCERIVKLMEDKHVIIKYRSPWFENEPGNEVLALLNQDRKKLNPGTPVDFRSAESESGWTITPKNASPLDGRTVPTVYVTGKLHQESMDGVRASLWVSESIEHLEINRRPFETIQKLTVFPKTIPRVQYAAIRDAIKEGQMLNLPEFQVVTDSIHFIGFFKMGWRKKNGGDLSNKDLYLEIKALTEKTKVYFKGVRFTEESDDELMKKVHAMANGVKFTQNMNTKDHEMSMGEVLSDKDTVEEPQARPACVEPEKSPSPVNDPDRTTSSTNDVPVKGTMIPTVHVTGRLHDDKTVGVCSSLWVPNSIKHLNAVQRPLGLIQRLQMESMSLPQVQYVAIRDAIKEAVALNLPEIRVISDSQHFVLFFKCGWQKNDGSWIPNETLYFEIKALTEKIKVHFNGVGL